MKLFVTGATGFIGSHFLVKSLQAGHEVLALRRSGSSPRIHLGREPVWVEGNLESNLSSYFNGVDVLVHLAAHTPNVPYDTLDRCIYWNVSASLRLALCARSAGVEKFLVAGSCFEYGRAALRVPKVTTSTPLQPMSSYPTSKAAASIAFEGFARETGALLKILRIFQVYGEGEGETRLWPSLRRAALSGADFELSAGEQVRDFVRVEDVALKFVEELDFSDTVAGEPIVRHVGSGVAKSLREFSIEWWSKLGATGQLKFGAKPYRPNEIMRLIPEL